LIGGGGRRPTERASMKRKLKKERKIEREGSRKKGVKQRNMENPSET